MAEFKPKLRVQLLNENGTVKSDRLVDQRTELSMGPKEPHKGAMRYEVTFLDKSDIDDFFKYVKTYLSDTLPERPVLTRGRTAGPVKELESPREDILVEVENLAQKGTQDDIISYLRKLGFVFLLTEDFLLHFKDFPFDPKDVGEPNYNGQYLDSYAWMARCIKRSKGSPTMDKYDCMILFGFRIFQKKKKVKIVPYLFRERKAPLKVDIKEGNKNSFRINNEFTRFPHFMQEEERLKFQTEMRAHIANHEKKPSKFFLRWCRDVLLSKDMEKNLAHLSEMGVQFKAKE